MNPTRLAPPARMDARAPSALDPPAHAPRPMEPSRGRATFRRILVGHDASPGSSLALQWAHHLASLHHARVLVASVAPVPEVFAEPPMGVWRAMQARDAELAATLRLAADEAAERFRAHGVRAQGVTAAGRPDVELLALARDHDADLVVVGSNGNGALSRLLLGSVAETMAARARSSVLVARTAPPARSVLCPVDGSPASQHAASIALAYATRLGVPVVVQHVVPDPEDAPSEGHLRSVLMDLRLQGNPRLTYALDVGRPTGRIVERARRAGCDLVVMGARGRGGFPGSTLGSVGRRVAALAQSSVLLAREPHAG